MPNESDQIHDKDVWAKTNFAISMKYAIENLDLRKAIHLAEKEGMFQFSFYPADELFREHGVMIYISSDKEHPDTTVSFWVAYEDNTDLVYQAPVNSISSEAAANAITQKLLDFGLGDAF